MNNPPSSLPDIPTDRPTAARAYGWALGSKDNYAVDREYVLQVNEVFPEMPDICRQNRQFLYRAVRYFTVEAGITQFLDLGSGLPTDHNVHQVAQRFNRDARVVYVDNDPIVLVHGQALLAEDANTAVITADMTQPELILEHPDTQRLIDFNEPVAVLMFSIPHCIPDDADAYHAIHGPMQRTVPGSYLAISHIVADDETTAAELTRTVTELGMDWKTRTPDTFATWLADLDPVEPGLADLTRWRPDPEQPPLDDAPPELRRYLGQSLTSKRVYEYGGVLRKCATAQKAVT